MDEFRSPITQPVLSQPEADQCPLFAPELILIIIEMLSRKDQLAFSLLSKSYRQLALSVLFRKVNYFRAVPYHIQRCNEIWGDFKPAIRELSLYDTGGLPYDCETILFPFLRSLPNLKSFQWKYPHSVWRCNQDLFQVQLVASLQHCPLEHFTYWSCHDPGNRVTGPPRLKSLSIRLRHDLVYDLIRPSFSTLVELELFPDSVQFDLVPLKPVGNTLRKFIYQVNGFDPDILDTIPDVFPHLTILELKVVKNNTQDLQWKASYDDAIAKNTKLQYLDVYADCFIFCRYEHSIRHIKCKKCGNQRMQVARALAKACPGLKRCRKSSTWSSINYDNCSEHLPSP